MIHPKAIVDKGAVLGENVRVGAYAVIEKDVRLGNGVNIAPFVHVKGNTVIGDDTFIATGAVIGEAPQMVGMKENRGNVRIGTNNIIREHVTIHASISCEGATVLGNNNLLMAFSHVAHDCVVEDNIVMCPGALAAGHVHIYDCAFISGNVTIHQFVRIGKLSMIGGLSRVNQDVLPFAMVVGDSRVWGINSVGVKRAKFTSQEISSIKCAYNILYRQNLPIKTALEQLTAIASDKVKEIAAFISASKRGICGPKRSSLWEKLFLDYPYFLRTKIPAYEIFRKRQLQRYQCLMDFE